MDNLLQRSVGDHGSREVPFAAANTRFGGIRVDRREACYLSPLKRRPCPLFAAIGCLCTATDMAPHIRREDPLSAGGKEFTYA